MRKSVSLVTAAWILLFKISGCSVVAKKLTGEKIVAPLPSATVEVYLYT